MSQSPNHEHYEHHESTRPAPPSNPYVRREASQTPELDAEAPYLRADDVQRLNRKALLFLAVIVIVLAGLAAWIFSGGLSQPEPQPERPSSERVVIPEAPRDLPSLPPERPPVQVPAPPELPPLPVVDDEATVSAMPGGRDRRSDQPSLLERRMQDAGGVTVVGDGALANAQGGQGPGAYAAMAGEQLQQVPDGLPDGVTSARPLHRPSTLLLRGTYIRCVLQSRVISDFPGYTSCIVTEPVYSVDGKRLLLPRGSKVQGSYGADDTVGNRVAIVWDRITTPTGLDINMRSPGVDRLGSAGNPGHYSAHWGHRIASSLLISILSDAFKYAAAESGPPQTSIVNGAIVQNPYESSTARTMERLANMAADQAMRRPPTVTINQGTIINVYVSRDVDFSAVMR